MRQTWGQGPPGPPRHQDLEEVGEQDRELGRLLQEQSELDREQEEPAVVECGDFTQMIPQELRFVISILF